MPSERLFEVLEPPPGGAARLRARIAVRQAGRGRRRFQLTALAATLLVVAVVFSARVDRGIRPELASPELDVVRMQVGLLPAPSEPVTVPPALRGTLAVQRVPLSGDTVVFYRVASLEDSMCITCQ